MKNCAVGLLCLIFFIGCQGKKDLKEEIRPVLTEKVSIYTGRPPMIFSGFSKSQKFINASFRVGGLVEYLPIKVGDRLQKGDLIARLDGTDFDLRVQKAEATLEEALAELRRASAQYKRIKSLYESESASRDELDTARAFYESAKATVEQSSSALDLSKQELDYTLLVAEHTHCQVAEKDVEINENVAPGQTIATLTCGTTLEVEIAIPESEIAQVLKGDAAQVFFNTLPDETFQGTVQEVGVSSSEGSTFPVTITLLHDDPRLRSGMAVKAVIPRPELPGEAFIIVPLEAVGEEGVEHFVYIFKEGGSGVGVARKVYVEIGELVPQGIAITSGLTPNDELIIAGLRYLFDGKKVKRLKDKKMFKKKRT